MRKIKSEQICERTRRACGGDERRDGGQQRHEEPVFELRDQTLLAVLHERAVCRRGGSEQRASVPRMLNCAATTPGLPLLAVRKELWLVVRRAIQNIDRIDTKSVSVRYQPDEIDSFRIVVCSLDFDVVCHC